MGMEESLVVKKDVEETTDVIRAESRADDACRCSAIGTATGRIGRTMT